MAVGSGRVFVKRFHKWKNYGILFYTHFFETTKASDSNHQNPGFDLTELLIDQINEVARGKFEWKPTSVRTWLTSKLVIWSPMLYHWI